MDIKLQAIIALGYIIISLMLLCFYLIHKYGKVLGYDMGPKIGQTFPMDKFNHSNIINSKDVEQLNKAKTLLCFVSMECPSCKEVLNYISENYTEKFQNCCVVVEGNKEEVEEWYIDNNYKFYANYIQEDILFNDLKINRFPYAFSLEYSKVVKKGPIFKEIIDDYISLIAST